KDGRFLTEAIEMNNLFATLLSIKSESELALPKRANGLLSSKRPFKLSPYEKSIQFLRGVDSKAGFSLAGFYLYLASRAESPNITVIDGYPGVVFQSYIKHSTLGNLSLACRKIFDHGVKGGLTGAVFAKTSDDLLRQHAEYWSKSSGRTFAKS